MEYSSLLSSSYLSIYLVIILLPLAPFACYVVLYRVCAWLVMGCAVLSRNYQSTNLDTSDPVWSGFNFWSDCKVQ